MGMGVVCKGEGYRFFVHDEHLHARHALHHFAHIILNRLNYVHLAPRTTHLFFLSFLPSFFFPLSRQTSTAVASMNWIRSASVAACLEFKREISFSFLFFLWPNLCPSRIVQDGAARGKARGSCGNARGHKADRYPSSAFILQGCKFAFFQDGWISIAR